MKRTTSPCEPDRISTGTATSADRCDASQLRCSAARGAQVGVPSWYDQVNLSDMAAVPRILGGRRFIGVTDRFASPTPFNLNASAMNVPA